MRAVIVATGFPSGLDALGTQWPSPMLPVGDRPLVQHVLERLVVAGCTQIDVVLGEAAERIEQHLGDGQRWGARIRYHLTSGFDRAVSTVAAVARQGESFLLAQADLLPVIDLSSLPENEAVRFVLPDASPGHTVSADWTGWAWVPGKLAAQMPTHAEWASFETWLRGGSSVRVAQPGLTGRDGAAWLLSQQTGLTSMAESLHFSAFPSDPGIWIGRNVSLPPDTELIAPVLIGDNSQIGSGVRLGPGAVICPSCVIDDRTTVAESVILEGSYVGRDLDVHGSVINRGKLLNVRLGAAVQVTDAFLLGGISTQKGPAHRSGADAIAGIVARLLLIPVALLVFPLLLIRALMGNWPAARSRPFAVTPAPPDTPLEEARLTTCLAPGQERTADGWRHFWLVFVPGLSAVLQGKLDVVGPRARTTQELQSLSEDWRNFCLQCRPGLISECFVIHGPDAEEELEFMSDAMHAATANWRSSLKIAGRYAALLSLGRPKTVESGEVRRTDR